jgi:lycopene beta-cyclase
MLEQEARIGGEHTWSFHESDFGVETRRWIAPLIAHSWPHQEVRFPNRRRRLRVAYHSITSQRFHSVISEALGDRARLETPVSEVRPDGVTLADGTRLEARAVIDGRGPLAVPGIEVCYQKFLGLRLRLERPHGLAGPIIMDATVPQRDGYRFVYVLPLEETELLVEDTYYSDTAALDPPSLRRGIAEYATRSGWSVARVSGEERGVLPIVLDGDPRGFWPDAEALPRSGLRAGLFHPTTGYSLTQAVALAEWVADRPVPDSAALHAAIRDRSLNLWHRGGFYRMLNRMLFRAAEPNLRYRVLEHFYRLPEDVVCRFYAGGTTALDRARILSGRPPVPIGAALKAMRA